jgi:hypothetical protein
MIKPNTIETIQTIKRRIVKLDIFCSGTISGNSPVFYFDSGKSGKAQLGLTEQRSHDYTLCMPILPVTLFAIVKNHVASVDISSIL